MLLAAVRGRNVLKYCDLICRCQYSLQSPHPFEPLRSVRRVSIRYLSRILHCLGIVALIAAILTLFGYYRPLEAPPENDSGTPHVDNTGQLRYRSTSSMLTADEMYYATFGESSNSSSSSSLSSPIWSEWSPDARINYLNYIQMHIAKPTPKQKRKKKQWLSAERRPVGTYLQYIGYSVYIVYVKHV